MAKSLNDVLKLHSDALAGKRSSTTTALTTGENPGVDYADKMKDTRDFIAQHSVEKFDDRVGNGDDVYQATNVKKAKMERHGHEPKPKDIKVYNKTQQVSEEKEDMSGKTCKKCKKGKYVETSQHDDMKGVLHCSKCGSGTKRWALKEEADLDEGKTEYTVLGLDKDKSAVTAGRTGASRKQAMKLARPAPGDSVHSWKVMTAAKGGHVKKIRNTKSKLVTKEELEFSEADNREYDYEGDMAITQLKTICRNAEHLMKMMKPDTDLPEWVQSKITKAEDYISTAHDYLMSEMNEEALDEGGSQYRSAAGSGKNTNSNLSRLARKLSFEKPKSYRPHGTPSKAESKAFLDAEVDKFMKKGGKIRKEEVEQIDELENETLASYAAAAGKSGGKASIRASLGDKKAKNTLRKRMKGFELLQKKAERGEPGETLDHYGVNRKKITDRLAQAAYHGMTDNEKEFHKAMGVTKNMPSDHPKYIKSKEKFNKIRKLPDDAVIGHAIKILQEEAEKLDEAKCNMTEAGKMCEVHGMKDCKKSSGKKLLLDKDIKEKTMTAAEKKKEESLKDKYDDSDMKEKMKKQYGDKKGEQVYFAYIRKQAMQQESISDQRSSKRTSTEEARKEIYKAFLRKKERKEKMKEATTDTTNNYTVDGSNNLGFKL